MKLKPTTVIVVLHYNKIRLTTRCVKSILDAGYPANQVLCFDNGSKEEVYRQLKHAFPECRHQRIQKNLGFSGGFNRSLEHIFSCDFTSALFCTNDTVIFPGTVEACEKSAAQSGAGMVAPMITYLSSMKDSETEAIDSIGAYFDFREGMLHHYHDRNLPLILDPARDYIPGTAVWINKETYLQLGGTDESFHMYWEDVDLCFRASRSGIPMARCYDARVGHAVGQTNRKKPLYTTYYFHRNRIRFCKRYLEGDNRKEVLAAIKQELLNMRARWQEKGDSRRLGYLEQLLEELSS